MKKKIRKIGVELINVRSNLYGRKRLRSFQRNREYNWAGIFCSNIPKQNIKYIYFKAIAQVGRLFYAPLFRFACAYISKRVNNLSGKCPAY